MSELRSRNTDHLDSREINDIECRALAMLRDHSLLNPARNSRKSNKSKPCRRDGHDTSMGKPPERSSNLTDDRISSDDGPDSLGTNTAAKDMDAEQTLSPGHATTLNRRSTMPREGEEEEARDPQAGQKEEQTVSTEYKARQDLDEADADGTKLYNEYKRGELLVHGEDTYKNIKLDLKAINEFLNNTKECETAPPQSNSSVKSPMEQ